MELFVFTCGKAVAGIIYAHTVLDARLKIKEMDHAESAEAKYSPKSRKI